MPTPPVAREKLDALGIDAISDAIRNGCTMSSIAEQQGISFGSLSTWIASDTERSARVKEARIAAAQLWDELAVDRIANAADPFELAKAKEIAYHYRWRASKIAPREYGDKVQQEITGADGKDLIPTSIAMTFVSASGNEVEPSNG